MPRTADRVKETSTTTGTGTYSLSGASVGFQSFVAGIGDGKTCYYCATNGADWEVGVGTVTDGSPDTLARTSVLASSNAGAAVSWAAGTRDIFVTFPAYRADPIPLGGNGDDGDLTVATATVTEITGPKHYDQLVLEGSGILTTTAARALVVYGRRIDLQSTSAIKSDGRGALGGFGGAGSAGIQGGGSSAGTAGSAGAVYANLGFLTASCGGGGGGSGWSQTNSSGNGGAGGDGSSRRRFDAAGGSAGGAGGNGVLNGPGNVGSQATDKTAIGATERSWIIDLMRSTGALGLCSFAPGGGGGGGSGACGDSGGTSSGGSGGSGAGQSGSNFGAGSNGSAPGSATFPGGGGGGQGGCGAAHVYVEAAELTLATGARISSNGAAAGNGGNTTQGAGIGGGGGGGGSGGAGGAVIVRYGFGTNVDTTRCVATGGAAGTGGDGYTAGAPFDGGDGASGRAGEDGLVSIMKVA